MAGEQEKELTAEEARAIAARIEEGIKPGPGQDEVDAIVAWIEEGEES